jgi:hypothetical protein
MMSSSESFKRNAELLKMKPYTMGMNGSSLRKNNTKNAVASDMLCFHADIRFAMMAMPSISIIVRQIRALLWHPAINTNLL